MWYYNIIVIFLVRSLNIEYIFLAIFWKKLVPSNMVQRIFEVFSLNLPRLWLKIYEFVI